MYYIFRFWLFVKKDYFSNPLNKCLLFRTLICGKEMRVFFILSKLFTLVCGLPVKGITLLWQFSYVTVESVISAFVEVSATFSPSRSPRPVVAVPHVLVLSRSLGNTQNGD